jgi:hypothetical protein
MHHHHKWHKSSSSCLILRALAREYATWQRNHPWYLVRMHTHARNIHSPPPPCAGTGKEIGDLTRKKKWNPGISGPEEERGAEQEQQQVVVLVACGH